MAARCKIGNGNIQIIKLTHRGKKREAKGIKTDEKKI